MEAEKVDEVKTNTPVAANVQGFQAWMLFTAQAGKEKSDEVSPNQRGSEAVGPEDKTRMPTLMQRWTEEGKSDDEIREVDLDLTKAANKLGRLCKTGVILQALESSSSRDRVVSSVRDTMSL
ncbi:hypothetical protein R1sor_024173 [Riccia sorocarpa]|uniref:Uncharacterized protein n=1 Tax=Riccia sorocarpa TaxID=122646 RepID=A0ABD3GSR0_9MARC